MKTFRSIFFSILITLLLTGLTISESYIEAKYSDVSKYRVGCVCCDDSTSTATGRGACSHHGGVKYWLYDDGSKQYTGRCE